MVASRYNSIELGKFSLLPKRDLLAFPSPESTCAAVVGVGHHPKAMGDSTTASVTRAQGIGGVHPACWGSDGDGDRAGSRLKPNVKVTTGGDTLPRVRGNVVIFENMREIFVAYLDYEQQMHVTNEDGEEGGSRRRELVDSVTQMMVAGGFYDDKPWIDLSDLELRKGLEALAGVDVRRTSDDVDFGR